MIQLLFTIIIAEIVNQLLKLLYFRHKLGKFDARMLFTDGGFPSGHSVTVATLTTGVVFETGFSVIFVVSLFFSLIVLRDATGVRRATGRQALVLNELMGKHHLKGKKLRELIGHTPWQVFWGVILGIIVASISYVYF